MGNHSPGPWKWDGDSLMNSTGADDFLDNCVMHCPGAEWPPSDEDKSLIAAAPEMLELLHRFNRQLPGHPPKDGCHCVVCDMRELLKRIADGGLVENGGR